VAVCTKDCFKYTEYYNESLEFVIPGNAERLGLEAWLKKNASVFEHMIQYTDCDFCKEYVYYEFTPGENETRDIAQYVTMTREGDIDLTPTA
jgi:hypothetical protein